MQLHEAAQKTGLSKRAIKFYEEKGLICVEKEQNGYRNYTEKHIETLKEISFYRKLGISLEDIKALLGQKDSRLLKEIYEKKKLELNTEQKELDALARFLETRDIDAVCSSVDYHTISQAMQEMLPGFYGYYFMNHFLPYLQISIETPEQQKAYETIINFWDNAKIRIPLFFRATGWITYRFTPKEDMAKMVHKIDTQLQSMLHPTEEEYQKLVADTKRNVKLKNSLLFKYHPAFISQRRFMKQLQDCGYNDIFIPAMTELSPKYRAYHEALMEMNRKICSDLGLYYDSNYRLVMKDKSSSL